MATYTRTQKKFDAAVYNQTIGDGKEDFILDEAQSEQKVEGVEVVVLPVFTGVADITHDVNSLTPPNYMLNVLAHDEQDGNITHKIAVDDSDVNLNVIGTYDLVYTVKDSMDNEATVTVTVNVVDAVVPVIEGMVDITHEFGDAEPDYMAGVTATDGYDGDLTASIVIDASAVDLLTLGAYDLVYTVEDANGNIATETVTVTVVDTVDPVIAGTAAVAYTIGNAVPDYTVGVTATDNYDGDITASIVVDDSLVDYELASNYDVTYTVADSSGNTATETIVVTVQ